MIKVNQTETQLVIQHNPHPVRCLISSFFLIAGGYFFYYLMSALFEYVSNATPGEWLAALPGMTILVILGLIFSLPGLFLVARETVTVSQSPGVIQKGRELLSLKTRRPPINIGDIEKVICRQKTKKHIDRAVGSTSGRSSSVTSYLIELELSDGQNEELISYSEKLVVKKTAKSLALFAELPLNDRL